MEVSKTKAGLWLTAGDAVILFRSPKDRPGRPVTLSWEGRFTEDSVARLVNSLFPAEYETSARLKMAGQGEILTPDPGPLSGFAPFGSYLKQVRGLRMFRGEFESARPNLGAAVLWGQINNPGVSDVGIEVPTDAFGEPWFRKIMSDFIPTSIVPTRDDIAPLIDALAEYLRNESP